MPRTSDPLALDDQLCFALYAASRAMTALYRPLLEPLGLTYPQFLVMLVLWDDGPTSVNGIGERLRLDSGTLSPLLKRLEANGLVSRTRSEFDERSVIIKPTPKGRRLRERAVGVVTQLRCALDNVEIDDFVARLGDLENALRQTAVD